MQISSKNSLESNWIVAYYQQILGICMYVCFSYVRFLSKHVPWFASKVSLPKEGTSGTEDFFMLFTPDQIITECLIIHRLKGC